MKVKIYDHTLDLIQAVSKASILYIDTESSGFYQEISLFQTATDLNDTVHIVIKPDAKLINEFLKSKYFVAFNAAYDISTIQQQSGDKQFRWENFDCAFLAAKLAYYQLKKHSFDSIINYIEGRTIYDNKKEMQKSFTGDVITDEQKEYAAKDVFYLKRLWESGEIQEAIKTISYKLDKRCLIEALQFQWNGYPFSVKRASDKLQKLTFEVESINLPKTLNVNSYQQVRAFLDSEESDDLYLAKQTALGNEKAGLIRKKRKALKLISFINKYFEIVVKGRLYGKFSPSTKSGRFSSSDINQQQHPRALKCCFGTDDNSDKVIIYSDYPQLELRTIAAITKDRLMTKWFMQGLDPHGEFAKLRFGANFTSKQRYMAKTANFGLLYAAGGKQYATILLKQSGILITEQEGMDFKRFWRNKFTGIKQWQDTGIRKFKAGKNGETVLGRKYTAERLTDFLNIENQGTGAEVSKLALVELCNRLKEEGLNEQVKIVNFIHDSFILESPKDKAIYIKASEILADSMIKGWQVIAKKLGSEILMPIEVFVGHNLEVIEENYLYKLEK